MSTDLRTALTEHLDSVTPPAGDLDLVVRSGTRRRRRRRVAVSAVSVVTVAVTAFVASERLGDAVDDSLAADYPSLGAMDFSHGLRAYADPGREIHLGGRTFDASDLAFLDTDAVATPYGVVFYDGGRPMLLAESGEVSPLVEGPVEARSGFHPTAKMDSTSPQVGFATLHDGVATVTVRDLRTGEDVASHDVECGTCGDLVIDALDGGALFYRTGDGTMLWDVDEATTEPFAGSETRIADVRAGVVLFDGEAPGTNASRAWLLVRGAIDAQLTFDGRHILSWSSRLQPTQPGIEPVVLDAGPQQEGRLGFWTVDTDGSILVAAPGGYPDFTVFDCEVPSGTCAEVGPLTPEGGDPMFIGNDM